MKRLLIIVAGLAFAVFLWWHWKLGMMRYFDVDEFAYLHWARLVSAGQTPYIDFFFYIPPGFLWFLAPLFWIGNGLWPVMAARMLAFGVFAALCAAVGILFWQLRGRKEAWVAFLPGIILAFLPLPLDKFLEIRPDTLAMLFIVLGIILQLNFKAKLWFYAGLCYGLSVLVLPKGLPIVALAIFFAPRMLAGFAVPIGLFGVWLLTIGQWETVVYSLTRLPFETAKIAKVFVMQPDLFFYPNTVFYGTAGWSRELIVNHALWIIGLGVGIWRLLTRKDLLISGTFIIAIVSFMYLYPLRHAQYLIPIAVFVSFYAADAIFLLWEALRKKLIGQTMFFAGFIVLLLFFLDVFLAVNRPKLAWDNRQMLADMQTMWKIIPEDSYVLDLDGRTFYFKDPYYVCCLPFGQFEPYLSRPLPSLPAALETTNTQYIYEGQLERATTLSQKDQAYIRSHFQPDPRVPGLLTRIAR